MFTTRRPFLLFATLFVFSLTLNGCQYMPWASDEDEDLVFEDQALFDKKPSEDDFFAEEGSKDEGGFASVDQPSQVGEMQSDVESLQKQQEALTTKVRELQEVLETLEPRLEATQQQLEGSLGNLSGKSEFLEPEVDELKRQIEMMNAEIQTLRTAQQEAKMSKPAHRKGGSKSRGGAIPADYKKAHDAYVKGRYDESILLFQNYAVKNPPVHLQDNIHYWVGASYFKLDMHDDAIKQFETVINKYPRGNKIHDSRLMLGTVYHAKGDKARALDILESALNSNPPRDVRSKIQKKLSEIN